MDWREELYSWYEHIFGEKVVVGEELKAIDRLLAHYQRRLESTSFTLTPGLSMIPPQFNFYRERINTLLLWRSEM